MRKSLDFLYNSAAALAALFMVGLLVMILLSIVSRQLHFNVPGIDAYAGYLMAGAGFLALAHTLKRGEHIRVTLILQHLGPTAKRWLERWAMGAAAVLSMLFAYFSVRLVWNSHAFNDISTGNDATALWIPQLAMAIGTVVLAIAAIDEFILEWRGRVAVQHTEALRHE
ncbi:TRAP transporter small permease [Variovorax guangxiensis]|uniref:TRAP transporter small permease protein n=1 Tax=Variovorax guangxiensis TaxID=1775474 RepID=A0A502DLQ5_9BURK|nr:TRAP transporter small permease [Variovorax guangxiensis]RZI67299.1 MAG: TRAP transporter small permease [Variovorax sp.]TPG20721.1 TRAP transporter small permease [Variovorax ginsengisoli]TPG25692.1 TRAP transporter small permease [Variovorax guangxiensis]